MANYTIELYKLLESYGFELFDFDYPFYCDDEKVKQEFEQKFKDYFLFREIGQETVSRFKHQLKTQLSIKMPYYRQLYETELASKDINFMLNKDLREEFITELESNSAGQSSSNSTSNTETNGNNENRFFDSPQQHISNTDLNDYVSNITKDKTNTSDNSTSNNTTETTSTGKSIQKQTNLSQGNIGITSSAELLQKWRDVLINIDEIIIKDCDSLFMQVF